MSNPTTPFGWQMPTATDLVTDLPADFEVFGQAVATSMADLLGGTTGQILAKNSNTDMDFVWIANDQGDITGVTASSPLTGGGTSGAVTIGILDATTSNKGAVQLSTSTSSTSTSLAATSSAVKEAYDPAFTNNYYAGKNKIINGDFDINQRGFTSNTTSGLFNFDRWLQFNTGGSFTVTPQTFTAGAAPFAPYEGKNFLQGITASQSAVGDYAFFAQKIEDVRKYAGQTVTISFFAKANTGTPKIGIELEQNFGSGGSPSTAVSIPAGSITLTTSWARYSVTVAVPSISGKTIGTSINSSYLQLNLWTSAGATFATRASSIGIQNFTAQIWGVQVEFGSTATPFQTASGTFAGELALCQRYYWRATTSDNYIYFPGNGLAKSTTEAEITIPNPVTMRTTASVLEYSNVNVSDGVTLASGGVITLSGATPIAAHIVVTYASGLTQFRTYFMQGATGTSYLAIGAEL